MLSSGHRNLYMYQVSSSTVFFFVSYMQHTISPLQCIARGCFSKNYILLNLTSFIGLLNFVSLPCFVIVSATVSEICELNQNKKKRKNSVSNLRPFLGI